MYHHRRHWNISTLSIQQWKLDMHGTDLSKIPLRSIHVISHLTYLRMFWYSFLHLFTQ